jgi:2-dehydro-3-deoxygluconokinase
VNVPLPATATAIAAANGAGARVSVDLNFRKKLWSEAKAQATMKPLMSNVDVVIANEEDLQSVLGVHVAGADVASGALDVSGIAPQPRRCRASSDHRSSP